MKTRVAAVAAVALSLALAASVAAKAGASITAGDGPYSFGQTVPTFDLVAAFEPGNGQAANDSYWARADCYQNGVVVYAQYQSLTSAIQQGGWVFGPTPSWSGGAADCTLRLLTFERHWSGVGNVYAADTFAVGP